MPARLMTSDIGHLKREKLRRMDNDEHGHDDDHDEQTKHHDDDDDGDDDEMLILNNRSMRNRKMQQTIEAMVKILGEMRQR